MALFTDIFFSYFYYFTDIDIVLVTITITDPNYCTDNIFTIFYEMKRGRGYSWRVDSLMRT